MRWWIAVVLLVSGCDDVGSVWLTPEGCRMRGGLGVTMNQEVTQKSVKCTIEYRRES